jgi:pyruvate dehydrogenase E1 component alpha subunit
VDGFDPVGTWRDLGPVVEHVRSGAGPAFVEAVTYRLAGHTSTADYSYVPEHEIAAAMERDPTPSFRTRLRADVDVPEERLAEIDAEATEYVEDAFSFAAASPEPGPDELYRDVVADPTWRVAAL